MTAMLAGETRLISYEDSRTVPTNYDVPPTVVITLPNGATVDPAPEVTVSPEDADLLVHTLSFSYRFAMGGGYTIQWVISDGSSVLLPQQVFFVAYTDVESRTRELLMRTPKDLPDVRLDKALIRTCLDITLVFEGFQNVGYFNLVGRDRIVFDEALACFCAAGLRPFLVMNQGSLGGVLTRVKQGPVEYQTTYVPSKATKTPEELLIDEGIAWIRSVSCQANWIKAQRATRHIFAPMGPRRAAQERGVFRNLLMPMYSLFASEEYRRLFGDIWAG